ncbi:MAG: acetyl-CoA carboxylase biotin carboxyl carrier protein [Omnitrophica bacterium]|nr:acetyl-CoA carboxylase biotin carboxyl carrier protein [Candidatus Omnitrophota bacterium]
MNIKKIEEVVRLMEKHNLTEITIEEEGMKIHLQKGTGDHIEKALHMPSSLLTHPGHKTESAPEKEEVKNTIEVKAPMVGTFYKSPTPDAAPFVDVGSTVKEDDILCIIEAMKLMNEIKSEVSGKVVDVLVENGEPIEFGQVLFLVEPS